MHARWNGLFLSLLLSLGAVVAADRHEADGLRRLPPARAFSCPREDALERAIARRYPRPTAASVTESVSSIDLDDGQVAILFDTGNLVGDLSKMLRSYVEILNSTPLAAIVPSLAGERAHNPELSKLFDPLLKERRQPVIHALERAVERGEVRSDIDYDLTADLIFGPIVMRVFFTGSRINPKILGPVIDAVLRGITPRPQDQPG